MLKQTLITGAAVMAALAFTAPAQATTYFAGYTTAFGPTGFTPSVGFAAPGLSQVSVLVTDCCIVGDYYAAFVDGVYVGTTPFVPVGGSTLSSATFLATLGAGPSHTFQLLDQTTAILPAGVYVQIDSAGGVPEPATWAMMLVGFGGLGLALRTRKGALKLA